MTALACRNFFLFHQFNVAAIFTRWRARILVTDLRRRSLVAQYAPRLGKSLHVSFPGITTYDQTKAFTLLILYFFSRNEFRDMPATRVRDSKK